MRIVFDAQGNVLGRSDYLPFGETWNQSGALPRQRFTAQARDGEAGLDDFNARAYQPLFGRFTRPDPVSGSLFAPQSWNAYAYVQNRPLVATDPSGMTDEIPPYAETVNVVAKMPGNQRAAPSSSDPLSFDMWVLANLFLPTSWQQCLPGRVPGTPNGPGRTPTQVPQTPTQTTTPTPEPKLEPSHTEQQSPTAPRIGPDPNTQPALPSVNSVLAVRSLPSLKDLWNGTWFVGVTRNLTNVAGAEMTFGFFVDRDGFGYFASAGPQGGYNQSWGAVLGAMDGGREVFSGLMNEGSFSGSTLMGGSGYFKDGQIHGFSWNPGFGGVAASVSTTHTTQVYLWQRRR